MEKAAVCRLLLFVTGVIMRKNQANTLAVVCCFDNFLQLFKKNPEHPEQRRKTAHAAALPVRAPA